MPKVNKELANKMYEMYYKQKMTIGQICKITGYSRETVKNHTIRVKNK